MTRPAIAFTAPVGPGDAPLVVLGPSLGTSTILWEDVVPLLAGRFRVTAWDLPGHGAAPPATDGFTVAEIADAVAARLPELTSDPVLYAGVSLGGAVGLELALAHADRLAALAVVASGAQLGDPAAWAERAATVRATSTSSIIVPSAQRWFAPESMARIPELSGRLLHALQDADDESYARCCDALAAYDVRGRLAEISVPVRVLWGVDDLVAPAAKAEEVAAGVRHGSAGRIAGAAHLPPAEQPRIVADELLAFFRSIEGN